MSVESLDRLRGGVTEPGVVRSGESLYVQRLGSICPKSLRSLAAAGFGHSTCALSK